MFADPTDVASSRLQPWTVAAPLAFEGVGLHSGHAARVVIVPAPAGHGFVFHRVDLPASPAIPARCDRVDASALSTALVAGDVRVQTVEHLLAALVGMGVTDARIEVDGPELPVLDGSALPYARAIKQAGVSILPGRRRVVDLAACGAKDGDRSVSIVPADLASVTYVVDYGHTLAGPQIFHTALDPATFLAEIAPARTFCFRRDVEAMWRMGLARGGSVENAVVIDDAGYSSALRFDDELVRHKVLDLLGDLALLGADWRGHVVAIKAGHQLHNDVARAAVALLPLARTLQETRA